ncbi:MAG: phospholipase D family protein [Desulforhopalus sp.]
MNILRNPVTGKVRRLLWAGIVFTVLLIVAIVELFLKYDGIRVGEKARYLVDSYDWHNAVHQIKLVEDPTEAYLVRRQLIRNATKSIDLSVFLWREDETGLALMQELIAAAERGVRVRLLGDGVFFLREPDKVSAMAQSNPHFELRLYNPLDQRIASLDIGILENLIFDFTAVNHRLHIKILTIDGEQTLIGGRNIGDKYFGQDPEFNFIDRDILMKGPAVADAKDAFELFWQDSRTVTAMKLKDVAASEPNTAWLNQTPRLTIPEEKEVDVDWRTVNRVSVWYDKPGLIGDKSRYDPKLVVDRLAALVGSAQSSVLIETPYLVLGERSRALFHELRSKKPELPILFLTNSLASTDNWQTYAAFQAQLRSMLEDFRFLLYLKKPDSLVERSNGPGTISSLHSKTSIIDEQYTSIGSFNWDPRSGIWNAEIMVVIDDTSLATDLTKYLEPLWSPEASWVVAKRRQPIALEQLDAIGSTIHSTIGEIVGINVWPLTNVSCFELKEGKQPLSPYHPYFHENYQSVTAFPGVSIIDQRRILLNLLQPISGPLTPAL